MHIISTSFIRQVRDVLQMAETQIGKRVADMVEFHGIVLWTSGLARTEADIGREEKTR